MSSSNNGGNTVIALKGSFLRTQTRVLSQPLQPEARWRKDRGGNDAGGLSAEAIKDAVSEVNRLLRRHNKSVYSSLAIRHVTEQIDKLYWDSGAPAGRNEDEDEEDMDGDGVEGGGILRIGSDLRSDAGIAKLPTTWDEPPSSSTRITAADQKSYAARLKRLKSLQARRTALATKLTTYRTLLTLLEPYRNPHESVQPNLATRDAELAAELAKTRTLGVRVASRLPGWAGDAETGAEDDGDEDEEMEVGGEKEVKGKLDALMAGW